MTQLHQFSKLSLQNLKEWFNSNRFTILGVSTLLFFIAPSWLDQLVGPWLMQSVYIFIITTASINLMQTSRKKITFLIIAVLSGGILIIPRITHFYNQAYETFTLSIFTIYFYVIIHNLFKQMRRIKRVDEQVIIGSFTGYLLLGTMGFLTFCTIENLYPGSFSNTSKIMLEAPDTNTMYQMSKVNKDIFNDLYYFAFVSMTTLGYGDIVPISQFAKKAVILLSLIGPFYMATVVASMVGKYMTSQES